ARIHNVVAQDYRHESGGVSRRTELRRRLLQPPHDSDHGREIRRAARLPLLLALDLFFDAARVHRSLRGRGNQQSDGVGWQRTDAAFAPTLTGQAHRVAWNDRSALRRGVATKFGNRRYHSW